MTSESADALAVRARSSADVDAETLNAVRVFLQMVRRRYPIKEAILFGSRARGTHEDGSDADLALVLEGRPKTDDMSRERLHIALDMSSDAYDAMFETNVIVSPFAIWEDEYKECAPQFNHILFENILREGVRVA